MRSQAQLWHRTQPVWLIASRIAQDLPQNGLRQPGVILQRPISGTLLVLAVLLLAWALWWSMRGQRHWRAAKTQ